MIENKIIFFGFLFFVAYFVQIDKELEFWVKCLFLFSHSKDEEIKFLCFRLFEN